MTTITTKQFPQGGLMETEQSSFVSVGQILKEKFGYTGKK